MVPEIELSKVQVQKDLSERGYRVIGTSAVIDRAANAFEERVDETSLN